MLAPIGLPGLVLIAVTVLVLFWRGHLARLLADAGHAFGAFRTGLGGAPTSPQGSEARASAIDHVDAERET